MKRLLIILSLVAIFQLSADAASPTVQKIAEKYGIISQDVWYGYNRTKFNFKGYTAWVVEPTVAPAEGNPWTWTMQWAEAYVDRTAVPDLLGMGWYHVTLEAFQTRASDEALELFSEFQKFLVNDLGLNRKARLIGMSWGGFYSVRYATAHPENVCRIYLDAPLLNFKNFIHPTDPKRIGLWAERAPEDGNWGDDPRMPVNMAEKLAAAGIPIFLLYGGQDQVVNPELNCEAFAERFRKAGGHIEVTNRKLFGHHPHGLDPNKTEPLIKFFK